MIASERSTVWREGASMALDLSIVVLAEMAALPAGNKGVHGEELLGVVWGTTIGLALAHWFAFNFVPHGLYHGRVSRQDVRVGGVQFGAAIAVAVVCSGPIVLTDSDTRAVAFALAMVTGLAGYLVARLAGRGYRRSVLTGAIVLVLALCVATAKSLLTH